MQGYLLYRDIVCWIFIPFFLPLLQEKELYRWPIRETLKSMLAMGWSIDRTKDGESMCQQRENEKLRKISQVSQVNSQAVGKLCRCAPVFET